MGEGRKLDLLLRFEILAFAAAALVHAGVLVDGYEHQAAYIAETVIAVVLLAGLLVGGLKPGWAPRAVVAAQAFALLGTLVGVVTIVIGVGPRTAPDVVYHILMVPILAGGLWLALRWRSAQRPRVEQP
ncbi:MAG TPA: hypothetical protein VMN78_03530 [Longimicrobiales bacterium]|nr:hypothetical protein [Longimicrobiales bacterium]